MLVRHGAHIWHPHTPSIPFPRCDAGSWSVRVVDIIHQGIALSRRELAWWWRRLDRHGVWRPGCAT